MRRVTVIAKNTILESIRNKIFYVIMVFALVIMMISGALAHFDAHVQQRVMKDLSFTIISFFGLVVALFITIEQVPNELDRKTIYFLLTKPVYRFEFLAGKFLGVMVVLLASLAIMGLVLAGLLGVRTGSVDLNLMRGLLMMAAKLTIFVSVLIFFSTFLSKILNVALSLFVFLFGHVSDFLQYSFAESGSAAIGWFIGICQLLMPNFKNFDVQSNVVHNVQLSNAYVGILLAYAALFSALFLLLGHAIFRNRDL